MATIEQLKSALVQAHAADDKEAAELFASDIKKLQEEQATQEQQIKQQIESQAQGDDFGIVGEVLEGVGETVGSVVGNIAGQAASGIEMLARAPFQGLDTAIAEGKKTQQTVSEFVAPKSEAGKTGMEMLGKAMEIAEMPAQGYAGLYELLATQDPEMAAQAVEFAKTEGAGRFFGNKTLEATGSPLLATMVEASPEIAAGVFGLTQTVGKNIKDRNTQRAARDLDNAIKIRNNETGADLAKYRLAKRDEWQAPEPAMERAVKQRIEQDPSFAEQIENGIPRTERNKAYSDAAHQEWDEGLLNMVSASTKGDNSAMREMIDLYETAILKPDIKLKRTPQTIVGETMAGYMEHLVKERKKRGAEVGAAVQDLRGVDINSAPLLDSFVKQLQDDGVVFNKGEPITDVSQYKDIDFRNSEYYGSPASEKLLRDQIKRMANIDFKVDAFNLHNLKKSLPSQLSTAKKKEGGLVNKAETRLNNLRRGITKELGKVSEDYRIANKRFAEVIQPIEKFNSVVGDKAKIKFDGVSPENVGLQARKTITNYGVSPDMIESINDIVTTARNSGYAVNDDPFKQIMFSTRLNKRLGAFGEGGFQGLQESAISNVIGAIPTAGDATGVAGQVLGAAIRKLKRVDNERAIKAMQDYLDEAGATKKSPKKPTQTGTDMVLGDADFD